MACRSLGVSSREAEAWPLGHYSSSCTAGDLHVQEVKVSIVVKGAKVTECHQLSEEEIMKMLLDEILSCVSCRKFVSSDRAAKVLELLRIIIKEESNARS